MTASDVRIDSAQNLDARTVDAASDTNTVDTNTTDTNTADTSTTDTNTTDNNTTDTNRTDVSTGDACVRPNYSLVPYRANCPPGGTQCADPYSCITFSRFLPEYRCLIPCRTDCECEPSQNCTPMGDNTGNRFFCATLE